MGSISLVSLRRLNLIMAVLHALQGCIILLLSRNFDLALKTDHLVYNNTTQTLDLSQADVLTVSLPLLIVAFFVLSSLAHLIIATVYRRRYEVDLKKGINKARWVEYAISASIMIVAIALLVGVYDVSILVSMFALTAIMNLTGLIMEVSNQGKSRADWLSFKVGTFAGMVPWVIIIFYFWASSYYGDARPPTFVYWIFVSIFLFFSCFAGNMWLQYKKIGPWSNYLFGECAYIILSLVAKSALAWQVFAGTLRP